MPRIDSRIFGSWDRGNSRRATSGTIAFRLEAQFNDLAEAMRLFQQMPQGWKTREELLIAAGKQVLTLTNDWHSLVLKHRLETIEAEKKEQK